MPLLPQRLLWSMTKESTGKELMAVESPKIYFGNYVEGQARVREHCGPQHSNLVNPNRMSVDLAMGSGWFGVVGGVSDGSTKLRRSKAD